MAAQHPPRDAAADGAGDFSESVKPRRIVDQNLLADRRIRRPHRQLIEQTTVVDLEQRRHVGRLSARRRNRIRMRPIGTPDDSPHLIPTQI